MPEPTMPCDARQDPDRQDRRSFLRTVAAASLLPLIAGVHGEAADPPVATTPAPKPKPAPAPPTPNAVPAGNFGPAVAKVGDKIPRRKLGKSDVELPVITCGVTTPLKPEVFDRAIAWGINHFDTAASYAGAEAAIGAYLASHPGLRDKVTIATKPPDITTPEPEYATMEASLDKSLKLLGIERVDLFLGIHACPRPTCLTDEFLRFGEDMKKKGKIKLFGFSNHASTTPNLTKAATLTGIDVILVQYNFRFANNDKLHAAMAACVKAGIGLIAIKGQGFTPKINEKEQALIDAFAKRGFDQAQAKVKLVLEQPLISSLSVGMKTTQIADSSAGAALVEGKLSALDRQALDAHAFATANSYCEGCVQHCGGPGMARSAVADVMRCHMYDQAYHEPDFARQAFALIPEEGKVYLRDGDLDAAEARCPHQLPIVSMVDEARRRFGSPVSCPLT